MITVYFNYGNAARHFEVQFFPCRTNELDAVNRWGNFVMQWNSYWRRLAIKFSHEPKTALQISWLTESESGYVWTAKFDLNTDTCGRGKIESAKKSLRIQKYPTRMDGALKKLNGLSQACFRETAMLINYVGCFIIITFK